MEKSYVTPAGKLRKRLRPAIYFDTSVLVDYWLVEGWEMPETPFDRFLKNAELPHLQVARDLLRSQKRLTKVAEIRGLLSSPYDPPEVTAVITPFCVLELIEWYAETTFRQIASEAAGTNAIRRRNKKEVGDMLKKAWELWQREHRKRKGKGPTSGIDRFAQDTMLSGSFAAAHGFRGLIYADILNFSFTQGDAFGLPYFFA